VGGTGLDMQLIWVRREGNYFCGRGWTGQITLIPKENFSCTRNGFGRGF
jgi:hypothetical protein